MSEMADAIRELSARKGVSEDSIRQTIENAIKAAYKRTYGTADNCIVKFTDDGSDVLVYSRKTIVDGVYDPATEIELEEALQMSEECEEGDEIDILVDPHNFQRSAVATGKQFAHQGFSESAKDSLYNEYKSKLHEIIIGYYQRSHNGSIFVDLGSTDKKDEKIEGVLPVKFQSPRETYEMGDRIKAYITDIKKSSNGIQLILSRIDPDFVKKSIELEVPEIADGTVMIHKVVRDAGYRTKVAVYTNKMDIDPVGACVGLKGTRIQNVIRELEGEKIDILKYDEDPHVFIKNALSPAEVSRVVILDAEKKEALAIVAESQFSLAIGKNGMNVRLANRLCDWNIDVKTEEQAAELDLTETDTRKAAEELFAGIEEEVTSVAQLPGVDERVVEILKNNNLDDIELFVEAVDNESIYSIEGLSKEDVAAVEKIVNENVEFEEETSEEQSPAVDEDVQEEEEEEYFCPECGAKISLDMTKCPSCGVELAFEEE